MFVNFKLEDIKSGKVILDKEIQKEDVILIAQAFENESIDIANWCLFEVAETTTHRVYGFENKDNYVYMKMDSTGIVSPWCFKNHDLDGYSAFVADSINEAMKLFEKSYEPKFIKL